MRNTKRGVQTACIMAALWLSSSAQAQWLERTITLSPGWNAVYLDVQPEPHDPATVFAGLPIESVWTYRQRDSKIRFIRDAEELRPELPNWMMYVPESQGQEAGLTNLFAIFSGRSYLIEIDAPGPVNWTFRGLVDNEPTSWVSDSVNLKGFRVDPSAPPTFTDYFAPSRAHNGQFVFRLQSNGLWAEIDSPETERISPNTAYWVMTQGASSYQGPMAVTTNVGPTLQFGVSLPQASLVISNFTEMGKTITITRGATLAPPTTGFPALLGPVPLNFLRDDQPFFERTWAPFPAEMTVDLPARTQKEIALEVVRRAMERVPLPAGFSEGEYQDLLIIRDQDGTLIHCAVTADGLVTSGALAKARAKTHGDPHLRTGLWIGVVQIREVSHPTGTPASLDPIPVPAGHEFEYTIILHVDELDTVRLLSNVTIMRRPPTLDNDGNLILGEKVLITDDSLIPNSSDTTPPAFVGTGLRGDKEFSLRTSAMAFPLFLAEDGNTNIGPGWIRMHGGFLSPSGELELPLDDVKIKTFDDTNAPQIEDFLVIPFDHPHNPFVHQFHPDHDNLDPDGDPYVQGRFPGDAPGEGVESYSVGRRIVLEFASVDPMGLNFSGFGDNVLGGIYTEEIHGLYVFDARAADTDPDNPVNPNAAQAMPPFNSPPIRMSGMFRLERVEFVGTLNGGP